MWVCRSSASCAHGIRASVRIRLQPDSLSLLLRYHPIQPRCVAAESALPTDVGAVRRWIPRDQNAEEAARAADIEVIVSLAQAAAQRLGPERRGLPDVPHEPAIERAADQPDQG